VCDPTVQDPWGLSLGLISCQRGEPAEPVRGGPSVRLQAGPNGPDAPPLAPAMRSLPLRSASAPGGWRATRGCSGAVVASGRERRALCGAAPPASSPLRVPIRLAPPRIAREVTIVTVASGLRREGPDGSGVNGLTLGPLRLLGRLLPAGQGPAASGARLPLPLSEHTANRCRIDTRALEPAACSRFQDCFYTVIISPRKDIYHSFGVRSFYGPPNGW
jgi:hypothetical protein